MQRTVEASTQVEVPFEEAQALLAGDPTGIVGPAALHGTVHVEVGPARHHDDGVRVPVHARSLDGGPLRELVAELAIVAAGAGVLVAVEGTYHWDGRAGSYGGGVLAHRVARWLARDLVDAAGRRLVERATATCGPAVGD